MPNDVPQPNADEPQPPAAPSTHSDAALAALKAAKEAIARAQAVNAAPEPEAEPVAAYAAAASVASGGAGAFAMPTFSTPMNERAPEAIDLLGDVNLQVKIELGRTKMLVEDVLRLGEGSVVELDKLAGDPVDVYVNGRAVARGEVLVLNDNFCVRINEIIDQPANDAA